MTFYFSHYECLKKASKLTIEQEIVDYFLICEYFRQVSRLPVSTRILDKTQIAS